MGHRSRTSSKRRGGNKTSKAKQERREQPPAVVQHEPTCRRKKSMLSRDNRRAEGKENHAPVLSQVEALAVPEVAVEANSSTASSPSAALVGKGHDQKSQRSSSAAAYMQVGSLTPPAHISIPLIPFDEEDDDGPPPLIPIDEEDYYDGPPPLIPLDEAEEQAELPPPVGNADEWASVASLDWAEIAKAELEEEEFGELANTPALNWVEDGASESGGAASGPGYHSLDTPRATAPSSTSRVSSTTSSSRRRSRGPSFISRSDFERLRETGELPFDELHLSYQIELADGILVTRRFQPSECESGLRVRRRMPPRPSPAQVQLACRRDAAARTIQAAWRAAVKRRAVRALASQRRELAEQQEYYEALLAMGFPYLPAPDQPNARAHQPASSCEAPHTEPPVADPGALDFDRSAAQLPPAESVAADGFDVPEATPANSPEPSTIELLSAEASAAGQSETAALSSACMPRPEPSSIELPPAESGVSADLEGPETSPVGNTDLCPCAQMPSLADPLGGSLAPRTPSSSPGGFDEAPEKPDPLSRKPRVVVIRLQCTPAVAELDSEPAVLSPLRAEEELQLEVVQSCRQLRLWVPGQRRVEAALQRCAFLLGCLAGGLSGLAQAANALV